jgi:hypothetical protein
MGEVVSIGRSKARKFWDIEVEDDPHLFALASGVLTHNSKPNPMPESVTDRCTRSHEYIFMLTKSARYFYDAEAVKEPAAGDSGFAKQRKKNGGSVIYDRDSSRNDENSLPRYVDTGTRNRRDVWTISTKPFKGSHFAVFPPEIPEVCIKAATSERGRCPSCGAPWARVVEMGRVQTTGGGAGRENSGNCLLPGRGHSNVGKMAQREHITLGFRPSCDCGGDWRVIDSPTGEVEGDDPTMKTGRAGMNRPRREGESTRPMYRWEQKAYAAQLRASPHRAEMEGEAGAAFAHYIRTDDSGARPVPATLLDKWLSRGWLTEPDSPPERLDPVPCVVLDPFAGSGTAGSVAKSLGRDYILIEANPDYIELIEARLAATPRPPKTLADFATGEPSANKFVTDIESADTDFEAMQE